MAANRFPILRGPDAQQSRVQDNVSAVLGPIARALQGTPIMGAAAPSWVLPTLLNGFSPATSPFYGPGFQIDALGYVHFRGATFNAAGCAANTSLFLLPIEARPGNSHLYASSDGANFRSFYVTAAGVVATAAALGAGAALSLECVFQVGG